MPFDRPTGRTTAEIADHNSRALLETLRRSGALTRSELAARLGLSIPGITNVAQRLLENGLVVETKLGIRTQSKQYALDPDGAYSIGMRSHRGWTKAVLIDIAGSIRGRAVARGEAAAAAMLRGELGGNPNIVGIGIAAESSTTGGDLTVVPPVAAVLAEWWVDPIAAAKGVATILIEDRIRAGLFFNGQPFGGVHARAGHIGEMLTGNDRRRLDDVASTLAYGRLTRDESLRRLWFDDAAEHLLDAIFALTGFLRPVKITVGGNLSGDVALALIKRIQELSAAREPEATALSLPTIARAWHGEDAVLIGAALLPFFGRLLPDPR